MTFNPRPNASGDTLVSSRDQIRTNFEVIQSRFEDNHAEYGTGDGDHTRVDLVEQTVFPATAVNESWAASRDYNARTELVWRSESQAAGEQAVGADQFVLSAMPIRAAGRFVASVAVGATETLIGRSFNITSVTRRSNSSWSVVMPLPAPSADYFINGSVMGNAAAFQGSLGINYVDATYPASTTLFLIQGATLTFNTTRNVSFIVYGG